MWSPSQAAALRAAKRRPTVYPRIDLMPLLVVLVAILFVLMFGPGNPSHRTMPVLVPEVSNATPQPAALREDAMTIHIPRGGVVFFGHEKVIPEQIPALIRSAVAEGAKREVYLGVDRRARYGDVKPVLDQIHLAGIKSVVILANRPSN